MRATVRRTASLAGRVRIAGSKNYTSRMTLSAALANGDSEIVNPAPIDDALAMVDCLRELGVEIEQGDAAWRVRGIGGPPRGPARLNVRNAGAVARFLMAVCAASPEPIELYTPYPESLGRRPQHDLIRALRDLGAEVESNDGRLPVRVRRGALQAGNVKISGRTSSQFLSGLLFLAPLLAGTTRIEVVDVLRSRPLVRQTLEVLQRFGVDVDVSADGMTYTVHGPRPYRAGRYQVPGDWPAAATILCAAAVVPSDVVVEGVFADSQGERRVLEVLRRMGVELEEDLEAGWVRIRGGGPLRPVEFDGDQATDAVLAMVAAAAFADGTSRFYNIENLRYKECDRISDFCRELRAAGVDVDEGRSEIIVHGRGGWVAGGADISAHHDHRVLMALTIVGLRSERPLVLHDAEHVAKSYPDFFVDMRALGADIDVDAEYFSAVAVRRRTE